MATATQTPQATATRVSRGFPILPCVLCAKEESIVVELADVTSFHCSECQGDFDAADVRNMMDKWQAVLNWIDLAPPLP